jgi:hypothetical protein
MKISIALAHSVSVRFFFLLGAKLKWGFAPVGSIATV